MISATQTECTIPAAYPTLYVGAVVGGLGMLLCAYFLRLQLKSEMVLEEVCREDLITAWSHPSPAMHSAATLLQGKFRRATSSSVPIAT